MINFKIYYFLFPALILVLFFSSCSSKKLSSEECVSAFIIAAEQHDMGKAWDLLSPEAQRYYNEIGERNRKSGKGILEHDISEVNTFLKLNTDYKIEINAGNSSIVVIKQSNGTIFEVVTINDDGSAKIKGGADIKNLLKSIAGNVTEKEYYN